MDNPILILTGPPSSGKTYLSLAISSLFKPEKVLRISDEIFVFKKGQYHRAEKIRLVVVEVTDEMDSRVYKNITERLKSDYPNAGIVLETQSNLAIDPTFNLAGFNERIIQCSFNKSSL